MIHDGLVKLGEIIHDAMLAWAKENDSWIFYPSLKGGCAVGSALLVRQAKYWLGIKANFVAGWSHSWVEYDGYIYDLTATQYGCPDKVRVLPIAQVNEASIYASVDTRKISFVNQTWPRGQRPKEFQLVWRNPNKAVLSTRKGA
jgi:hypothetical protein